jgi:nucleotide-binding universal stress UspA family protein
MKILLPIDGSAAAMAAVQHALRLRRDGLDLEFVLANVQEPPSLYEVVVAHDAEVLSQVRRDAGADLLAPAEALLEAAGASWESEVAGGDPGHLLVELAENYGCDAVVMGLGAGAPGAVARAVLHASAVPVTLVRESEPAAAPEPGADDEDASSA